MDVRITIDDKQPRAALSAAPGKIRRANRAALNDATALLLRDVSTYPPAPPPIQGPQLIPVRFTTRGGKSVSFVARAPKPYRRTGTLRRSWSRTFDDRTGFVGSNGYIAPYNRYVQDDERQAKVHKGRWTNTVQNVAGRRKARIWAMFRERMRQYVGS